MITLRDILITCACLFFMLDAPFIIGVLNRQADALQQIATAQQAIAAKQDKPPEINAECHEALGLFTEWLQHDLRTGGSGRPLGHAR